jgi:hypothetical protein
MQCNMNAFAYKRLDISKYRLRAGSHFWVKERLPDWSGSSSIATVLQVPAVEVINVTDAGK